MTDWSNEMLLRLHWAGRASHKAWRDGGKCCTCCTWRLRSVFKWL